MNTTRSYKFVFLNACNSGFSNFRETFDADCFVGWKGSVKVGHARDMSYYFWRYMKKGYSAFAAKSAADTVTIGWYALDRAFPICEGNIILKK